MHCGNGKGNIYEGNIPLFSWLCEVPLMALATTFTQQDYKAKTVKVCDENEMFSVSSIKVIRHASLRVRNLKEWKGLNFFTPG